MRQVSQWFVAGENHFNHLDDQKLSFPCQIIK
jgi:hypothetical protein